jgi:hypothetical protein
LCVLGALGAGCDDPSLGDDRANATLEACCSAVRDRTEGVRDVEADKFRSRCGACRQGATRRQCERGASLVVQSVKAAWGDSPVPLECQTLRESMSKFGVSVPAMR